MNDFWGMWAFCGILAGVGGVITGTLALLLSGCPYWWAPVLMLALYFFILAVFHIRENKNGNN
jgi:hypothetical protein